MGNKDPCEKGPFEWCPECKKCFCQYYDEEDVWICHNDYCDAQIDPMEYSKKYEEAFG